MIGLPFLLYLMGVFIVLDENGSFRWDWPVVFFGNRF